MAHPSLLRTMVALCAMCGLAASVDGSTHEAYPEESVKAAFVFRFAGYVSWPEESVPADKFTIAVLGANDVAVNLGALVSGRMVMNRPVQVRRIASVRDAADAQVLYVGGDRPGDLRTLLLPLAQRHVLIVTDSEDGLAAGSAINFLIADQRVRFEISLESARRASVKISSDLLALAVRVRQ